MISRVGPGATTFIAERRPRSFGIVVTVLYGVGVLGPLVAGRYRLGIDKWSPQFLTYVPGAAFDTVLAIVAVAVIWGCSRAWRMGLRMDTQGVTVRNYFRTYRFGWAEVTGLVDGSIGEGKGYWALSVLGPGGRAVTASGTASQVKADAEALTAIRQAAAYRGIVADLTGDPGDRRGPKWQHRLLPILLCILLCLLFAGVFSVRGFHCRSPGGCGGD